MKEMTERHNMIQEVLVEAIRKHRKIPTEEILTNKEISYGKFQKELGKPKLDVNEEKQRRDIQFWADISSDEDKFETWKLYIIEISVPFGKGDQGDEHSNTLKKVIEFKTSKYAPLIKSINTQLINRKLGKRKFMVRFIPFVISSLGALPNKSINSVTRIIGTATKNTVGIWCKKLVVRASKGSFMIWVKAKPETLVSNRRIKEESDDDDANEEERNIREKVIREIDEELKLGNVCENEGDEERKNLIQEVAEEKERMEELNLPGRAAKERMNKEDKIVYNRKVMSQEDVSSYKEVSEVEERHVIQKQELNNEILIVVKTSKFPLNPEAEEDNSGNNQT
jgi:hypothetical protein